MPSSPITAAVAQPDWHLAMWLPELRRDQAGQATAREVTDMRIVHSLTARGIL